MGKQSAKGCMANNKHHTCNVRVRTEIEWTVVVSGRVGTVGSNVLPNLESEIEVVHHVLRDCTIVLFEEVVMEAILSVRNGKTLDVRRPYCGRVAAAVSHVARGGGNGGGDRSLMNAKDYKPSGRRNADSAGWADPCRKNTH